ncbi:TolC family protein [Meiothermus taiwanensis]|jgi:outer membrane protein|uniref:Type I secretion outer membrane protein, TolC family n=2 Tax=Meiothermus taiwanensis TaxID=172827 RepID=A0A399DXZ7_9DEIN|nr:TolC family protein [Meiothermus taiwanensis]AWR86716.1 outer membrane efflux protein [Meiothermus taiwanensis WR-220]RIH77037.1 type I secretion outer membrane protein, TolC family [Meiothermus taiwanensis]
MSKPSGRKQRLLLALMGAALVGVGPGWAQGFFAPLENHPSLLQARLGLEAAQAQLRATLSPVSFQLQGGLSFFEVTPPPGAPTCPNPFNPQCATLPTDGRQVTLGLTFTPFPFGDVSDAANQAALGVEQAALGLRQARTQLEAQAVEAAWRVRLAEQGLEVARLGVRLAQASLEATRLRASRGAASQSELRQAEASLRQAALQLSEAERNLALAQQTLFDLIGQESAAPPRLAVPSGGTPPQVRQAELQLANAQIAYDRALRGVLPVVQGSYTRNTSDSDALTISINSRTLQPSLSYTNQVPGRSAPQDRIVGTLQIGLSANIAFGVVDALEAAQKQVDAARQALEAARRSSKLQEDLLRSALQTAEQNLANALQARADAERSLAEARERERLGLASPLASLQAELALAQARLGVEQAELNRSQRILDIYRFYALPLSEVNR